MRFYIIFFLLCCLSGCKVVQLRGQYIDNIQIEKLNKRLVTNNKLSQNEIINIIGYPTFSDSLNKCHWYYAFRILTKRAFFSPKVEKQRIVKLIFDNDQNYVNSFQVLDDKHGNIKIVEDDTNFLGVDQALWKKLSKNFLLFNKKKNSRYKKTFNN